MTVGKMQNRAGAAHGDQVFGRNTNHSRRKGMPIVKKAPEVMSREVRLEQPVNDLLEDYARFIEEQPGSRHQCRSEESTLARPRLPQMARGTAHGTGRHRQAAADRRQSEGLVQRVLESRAFLAAVLAMGTGVFLFYTRRFPDDQIFLRVIAVRAPEAFLSFKYLYYTFLFHNPVFGLFGRSRPVSTFSRSKRSAGSNPGVFPSIRIRAQETIFFWSSVKCTTRASRSLLRNLIGSRFQSADCFNGSCHLWRCGIG